MQWWSYFCTAGKGTEEFVAEEVREKLQAKDVTEGQGKVMFKTRSELNKILCLKSVERVFILVKHVETPKTLNTPRELREFIEETGLQNLQSFEECLDALPRYLERKKITEMKRRKRQYPLNQYPLSLKKPCFKVNVERISVALRGSNETGSTVESVNNGTIRPKVSRSLTVRGPEEALEENEKISKHVQEGRESDFQVQEPLSSSIDNCDLKFRVSCKCAGSLAKLMSSQEVAALVGRHVAKTLHWTADMQNPTVEIYLHINDKELVIGYPVTKEPLSRRHYLKYIGLRSPVAWVMARVGGIRAGQWVLDPMCGAGTILCEASVSWPGAVYVGCDKSLSQLQKAQENARLVEGSSNVHLFHCDVFHLPVREGSFDVILCDIPFGQTHWHGERLMDLYQMLVHSFNRVLKSGGKVILLCGQTSKDVLLKAIEKAQSDIFPSSSQSGSCPAMDVSRGLGDDSPANDIPRSVGNDIMKLRGTTVENSTDWEEGTMATLGSSSAPEIKTSFSDGVKRTTELWNLRAVHPLRLGLTEAVICAFVKL